MMFLDYFGVFGWIYGKRNEISKIWANFGVLSHDVGIPPRQGVDERGLRQASGMLQRSSPTSLRGLRCSVAVLGRDVATLHSM